MFGEVGKNIIAKACCEKRQADGKEYLERRIERPHLENNQKKFYAIMEGADVAFALTATGMDGQVRHRIPCSEKRHGDSGRVGRTIRQQIEKFPELCRRSQPQP